MLESYTDDGCAGMGGNPIPNPKLPSGLVIDAADTDGAPPTGLLDVCGSGNTDCAWSPSPPLLSVELALPKLALD